MIKTIKNNFILSLVIFVFIYLVVSSFLELYIPCVFNEITGLYCPGCGLTRMLKSMLKLDFYQAFRYNPLMFIFFPFIIYMIIDYIYCFYKKKKSKFKTLPQWFWNILLIITILYWILRNIIPWLAPTVV